MKRLLTSLLTVLAATALQAYTPFPGGGVTGTMHDLSATGPNKVTNQTQVCVFCHTPHHAIGSVSGGDIDKQIIPLWNHTTTTSTFTMYNQTNNKMPDLQGTVDPSPSGASMACLSCHDGTVAVGSLAVVPYPGVMTYTAGGQVNATGFIAGTHVVGSDLTNDHPISITYQDNLDSELQPAAGLTGVQLFPSNATGNKVQCGSCHDVHNWGSGTNAPAGAGAPFLRVNNTGSALCLKCHKK